MVRARVLCLLGILAVSTALWADKDKDITLSVLGTYASGIFTGAENNPKLDEAARVAFVEYAYTLAEIGRVVSRHPSVVCRWIQRAARPDRSRCVLLRTVMQKTRSDPGFNAGTPGSKTWTDRSARCA